MRCWCGWRIDCWRRIRRRRLRRGRPGWPRGWKGGWGGGDFLLGDRGGGRRGGLGGGGGGLGAGNFSLEHRAGDPRRMFEVTVRVKAPVAGAGELAGKIAV